MALLATQRAVLTAVENLAGQVEAMLHLRSVTIAVPDNRLAHISPVGWEHIAFSGNFNWDRAVASTGRKALSLPQDVRVA